MVIASWFSELAPEFHIIFIAGIIMFALVIFILVKTIKMSKEIANKTLKLQEEILDQEGKPITVIKIINTGYIDNEINEIGLIYKDRKFPLVKEQINLKARSKHELTINHDELLSLIRLDDDKLKKLKVYYENNLGLLISIKAKKTRKEINQAFKENNKDSQDENLDQINDLDDEAYENIIVENDYESENESLNYENNEEMQTNNFNESETEEVLENEDEGIENVENDDAF